MLYVLIHNVWFVRKMYFAYVKNQKTNLENAMLNYFHKMSTFMWQYVRDCFNRLN